MIHTFYSQVLKNIRTSPPVYIYTSDIVEILRCESVPHQVCARLTRKEILGIASPLHGLAMTGVIALDTPDTLDTLHKVLIDLFPKKAQD